MKTLWLIVLTMLTAVLLGISGAAAAGDEIRIATQPIPHYAPIFIAKHKGWLDEELAAVGPKPAVIWTSFPSGPPMNESFAAGQQDIGLLGDTPAIIAKAAGIDTRIIGLTSSGPKSLAVIVPAGSNIRSPKDLKGRKVAVVKGSYAHHLLALVLKTESLTTNDIDFINLSQADIATAIVKGDIDAAAVWEPLITRLVAHGAVRVLADGTGIKKGVLVIVATGDFIRNHRKQVVALLRAYQRGAQFVESNPEDSARLIAEDVNLPPDLLVKVFTKIDFHPAIHADDIEEIKQSEAFMLGSGLIRTAVDIDAFIDPSLAAEGGIR